MWADAGSQGAPRRCDLGRAGAGPGRGHLGGRRHHGVRRRGHRVEPPAGRDRPGTDRPADLAISSHPAATGEPHGIRYAYFPDRDRLLVQQGARITSYDTTGRRITGFAQEQSTASHICFTSERGPFELGELKCVPVTP